MSTWLFRTALVITIVSSSLAGCGSSPESGVDEATPTDETPLPAETTPDTPDETTPQPPADAGDLSDTQAPPPFDPTTQISSGDGITVESVVPVSPRTFDVFVSTPDVSPKAKMRFGNAVRITVPPDYATSTKHYPVLYFLHGASCDYTTASKVIGFEERLSDVIVVMPEAGEYGFYTDWLDPSIPQKWETYHLTQLVPFIDRNLKTIAAKEGRAVAGFSMGGLGAMRYAADHPELFAAAATFSGIVDLQHGAVQLGIVGMLTAANLNVNGPFGPLGTSPVWGKVNPAAHAKQLATVQVFIYVGKGTDVAEATTASASGVLHKALNDAKVPHYYENYGTPGETPEGKCNGGHTNECARYATVKALPGIRAALADPQ